MKMDQFLSNYRSLTVCSSNENNQRELVFELYPTLTQTFYLLLGGSVDLKKELVSTSVGYWEDKKTGETVVGWIDNQILEDLYFSAMVERE